MGGFIMEALGKGAWNVGKKLLGEEGATLLGKATKSAIERARLNMEPVRYVLDGTELYPKLRGAQNQAHAGFLEVHKAVDEASKYLNILKPEEAIERAHRVGRLIEGKTGGVDPSLLTEQDINLAKVLKDKWKYYHDVHGETLGIKGELQNYMTHVFNKPPEYAAEIESAIGRGPGFRWAKSRTGAEGYEKNPVTAFLTYANDAERKIAFQPAVDHVRDNIVGNSNVSLNLQNYTQRLMDYILRPKDPLSQWERNAQPFVREATRLVMSGALGSPGSAFTNFFQQGNTLVELGPKYFAPALKKVVFKQVSPEIEDALKRRGLLEDLLPHEILGDQSKTGFGSGTIARGLHKAEDVAMKPFQMAEIPNRKVAFVGAYDKAMDLAKDPKTRAQLLKDVLSDDAKIIKGHWTAGNMKAAAEQYAEAITGKTQYFYGSIDTPMMMRHPLGKVATMFWSFPINTFEMLAHDIKGGNWTKAGMYALYLAAILHAFKGLGLDVSSKVGMGVLPTGISPILNSFYQLGSAMKNWAEGDEYSSHKAFKEFARLAPLWVPGGRFGAKIFKSIKKGIDEGEWDPFVEVPQMFDFPNLDMKEMREAAWKAKNPTRRNLFEKAGSKAQEYLDAIQGGDEKPLFKNTPGGQP